jgi:hypothetical protein
LEIDCCCLLLAVLLCCKCAIGKERRRRGKAAAGRGCSCSFLFLCLCLCVCRGCVWCVGEALAWCNGGRRTEGGGEGNALAWRACSSKDKASTPSSATGTITRTRVIPSSSSGDCVWMLGSGWIECGSGRQSGAEPATCFHASIRAFRALFAGGLPFHSLSTCYHTTQLGSTTQPAH